MKKKKREWEYLKMCVGMFHVGILWGEGGICQTDQTGEFDC